MAAVAFDRNLVTTFEGLYFPTEKKLPGAGARHLLLVNKIYPFILQKKKQDAGSCKLILLYTVETARLTHFCFL
ncbi:hypothetical protein D0469_11145 [Peribacillus saganii]|uniref:Uncharacterized protein n=1 Tax=Peribacillus saganii TaxID=2303992 RepID=A0A372LPF3_9BACI|nr:hypothetical protein D0469_11145 [Peribacillus saganii]